MTQTSSVSVSAVFGSCIWGRCEQESGRGGALEQTVVEEEIYVLRIWHFDNFRAALIRCVWLTAEISIIISGPCIFLQCANELQSCIGYECF